MELSRAELVVPDGRTIEFAATEGADRDLLIFHHGTPGSGDIFGEAAETAAAHGFRVASYSRPGYAGSSRDEGRTVADCAADSAAMADHLGADHFYTVGASGGGPHALACAALLPGRVRSCATIAGVGPYDAPDLDFLEGMAPENHEEFGAALAGGSVLQTYLESVDEAFSAVSGPDLAVALGELVSDVDRAVLTGDYADFLARSFHRATENGIWGWFDDDLAFTREWGFELSSISVPVTVWQGAKDMMVPYRHGEWLAANVAGATAELRPEHGHLSLALAHLGAILDGLRADR
jgi:pimeloyl-ACP methyl ester carboxylesterase